MPAPPEPAHQQEGTPPAIAAFAVLGLLADQGGQEDGYQPVLISNEDMRRRRAAARGPVVYKDEERTF